MSTRANPVAVPARTPLPVQFSPFSVDHFKTPEGVDFFNLLLQQIVNAINAGNGAAGVVSFPHGLDMAGASITGLGGTSSPTGAISSASAQSQFSPAAQQPQLDLGGKYALKGLTGLQMTSLSQASQIAAIQAILNRGISGTITLAKLTTGGTEGSITVVDGIITAFTNPT